MENKIEAPSIEDKEKEFEIERMIGIYAELLKLSRLLDAEHIREANDQMEKRIPLLRKVVTVFGLNKK